MANKERADLPTPEQRLQNMEDATLVKFREVGERGLGIEGLGPRWDIVQSLMDRGFLSPVVDNRGNIVRVVVT